MAPCARGGNTCLALRGWMERMKKNELTRRNSCCVLFRFFFESTVGTSFDVFFFFVQIEVWVKKIMMALVFIFQSSCVFFSSRFFIFLLFLAFFSFLLVNSPPLSFRIAMLLSLLGRFSRCRGPSPAPLFERLCPSTSLEARTHR